MHHKNIKLIVRKQLKKEFPKWKCLPRKMKREISKQNVLHGDVLTEDTCNCYLHSNSRLLATVGIDNHVVVETADAVLVGHKDRVQDVKAIAGQLKQKQRDEARLHRCVNCPWGTYECIDQADRFQVKRITVNPGATLSSQMHHHHDEHWIVVKGTAKVIRGGEVMVLGEILPIVWKTQVKFPWNS